MIRLQGVSKVFPGDPPIRALIDTDLSVEEGEWLSIVGPSGAGKSTIMHLIGLLDAPTSGAYLLNGEDVSRISADRRAKLRATYFGFVFQTFHLVPGRSLGRNVELGLLYAGIPRQERIERSRKAIEAVGILHRLESDVSTLSGGEKQRAVIARALASDAKILLCDEPTGNLDSVSGEKVFDAIRRLSEGGVTVIVVTHDPAVAALGDRVVSVVGGQIREGGAA